MRYNGSPSPLLASKTPAWRSNSAMLFMGLCFVGLSVQAAYVQVVHKGFYQKQGEMRFARTLEIPASRGRILDRNGLVLASSIPLPSLWACPEEMDKDPTQLSKLTSLAQLLGLPAAELNKKLADEDKSFVWVKRQLDPAVAAQAMALGIRGLYVRQEYKRQYPEGEASAQFIGTTNTDNVGESGIEKAFNAHLSGKAGSRHIIKNRLGKVVEEVGPPTPAVDGQDLVLSLDSKVQFFAYQKLRETVQAQQAKGGSVVVLDAQNGEVLALANYPSFDPNARSKLTFAQQRNVALVDTFEPGSTVKPLVMGLALDKGIVTPTTPIQTAPGRIHIGNATISDAHPHGVLSASEVIQKSSNVGIVKIALQLPAQAQTLWALYNSVGFGQKPALPFPGVATGRLRASKNWHTLGLASASYGYGLSVSLFQLAQAYTVFAHGGQLLPASLVKLKEAPQGLPVLQSSTALAVRQMLHAVTQPGGTAPKAQPMGYPVGGKTGTTHKQEGHGYAQKKYRSFFVGLAPLDQPKLVVAVMVDEPSKGLYFGGDVAAPVFRDTVQHSLRVLGVPPNLAVQPQPLGQTEEESF